MLAKRFSSIHTPAWIILGLIWLGGNLCDRLWLILDHSLPAWDQSNHLTKSLQYFYSLNSPEIFNGEWWRNFWMISTKYPPFTYIVGAFFQKIFGLGNDQALLSNLLYNGILIVSIYFIGKTLFSSEVGLWSAGLSMLFPRLYQTRLQFLIDTPSMTLTVACFCCLTFWKVETNRQKQWLWTILFGLGWGLALLSKQSIMFFLFIPLLYLGITHLWSKKWERVLQLWVSFLVSSLLWFPWYRTNWIYLFSTVQNSNAIPATFEGDPPLNTLAAWTYYWQDLPKAIGWVLLLVSLVGLLLNFLGRFPKNKEKIDRSKLRESIKWLGIYFGGSYLICSAIFNKDTRYIMSYLPILAVFLSYGLIQWRGKYKAVRGVTVIIAILVMITNLFPIPGTENLSLLLSPGVSFRPYLGQEIPVKSIIKTARETNPYQIVNLGVIANTDSINHSTINYYGQLADFQVYGRELGNKQDYIDKDSKSFDWFLSKTGDNGFARENQLKFADTLDNNPNFSIVKSWQMPDQSLVKLYHRNQISFEVKPLEKAINKISLDKIIFPEEASGNFPIPITYEWSGNWSDLQQGLVLLSWYPKEADPNQVTWIHDHGIGAGMLWGNLAENKGFKVTENMAIFPGKNIKDGEYILKAIYLNRNTNESYSIPVPDVTLKINNSLEQIPAPELDLNTQLREISVNLGQGIPGLDPIFKKVGRLNQYDPIQDYLKQTEIALKYRLNNESENHQLNWNYGLVLSQVLQENPQGAIAALKQLIKIAPDNPYHHAYLAFVYLYNWQPKAAENALIPALKIDPNVEEFKILKAISTVMQGNLIKGWRILSMDNR
ncbi:phospholipid carrier-dependent glycosyltransferase [Crocosphaera watsonii WH 8501]|uniref:Glycosyl transferase, family 39 n=2 Tax=Crocosphaera watsonii TaxID=263511 RepID=Q4C7G7_CROWT|nr:phospholipid carrier-dependent glycosyltransferase [Crocosphaera watsonii]EAM52654.1 Glycosyl transferase, family 39 [Crocosphaera watsonii WH 8501]